MAETAAEILELLEQRQLVSEKLLAKLRRKVGSARGPISARKLVKVLLDKGLVTPGQAKQLLKDKVKPKSGAKGPRADRAATDKSSLATDSDHSSRGESQDNGPLELDLQAIDDEAEIGFPSGALAAAAADPLDDDVLMVDGYEYQVGEDSPAGFDDDPLTTGFDAPVARATKRITLVTQRWDSKLILGGSGTLILLAVLGVFLYYLLSRGTAEDQFKLAESAYNSGNYMQAISDFKKYLDKFSKDTRVSEARVRIGLAQMWQEADVSKNWQKALDMTNTVLPTIESEESFAKTARPELAGLLATVADGFAEQARTSSRDQAQELVDLYEQTMVLVNNSSYVPSTQRRSQQKKLDDVEAKILTVRRNINRDQELEQTVAAIREASSAGQTATAYLARNKLLEVYPALEDNFDLQTAIREISDRQRGFVKVSEEQLTALTTDEKPPSQVALPSHSGGKAKGVDGHILYYLAGGAVYGIDASDGKALWRRFVGHESEIHPLSLGGQPGSDVLYVDSRRHELVRRAAADGSLVWRLPVEEPLLDSIVLSDRLIVATQPGRILLVDYQRGDSMRQVQLPQPLNLRPATDEKRGRIYAAADHSNLYVLDAETLECNEVYYIGHRSGAIGGPPVSALGILFVPERLSPEFSQLHVLGTDNNGLNLRRVQDPLRLDGHVVQPPIVLGRRVLVITNLGVIYLFEIDKRTENNPVSELTKTVKTAEQPIVPQAVVANGQLWVGDVRLTSYQLQTARGSIVRQRVTHNGDAFVGPMRTIDNVLFYMRQRANGPGLTVTASYIGHKSTKNADVESIWEIDLAVPPAGEALSQGNSKIIVVSSQAELYELGPDEIHRGMDDQSEETVAPLHGASFQKKLDLGDGRIVFLSERHPEQVVLFDPSANDNRLRTVELKIPANSLTTLPVAMGGSLLALSQTGQIHLVELPSGESKVDPFQPTLQPGQPVRWQSPAVVDDVGQQAVVYDGDSKLYRIAMRTDGRPRLVAQVERDIDVTLDGGLVAVGDSVYGVVRSAGADQIVSFAATDLAPGQQWDTEGHVVWGPVRVGDLVLAATDAQKLYCFQNGQQLRWTTDLPYGAVVGAPLLQGDSIMLSSLQGTVWRIAVDSGQELGQVVVGEPLGTGPVHWNAETLLLIGHDGTVYAVGTP